MKAGKMILRTLAGLILAGCVGIAAGTWLFPEENDLILNAEWFRVSVTGIGAGLSLVVILAFANGWIIAAERSYPENDGAGRILNGIGFGLLPGISVWKAFETGTRAGAGSPVPEGVPAAPWLTAEGAFLPGRIEMAAALVLFAAVILWLMIRRSGLPENGDLLDVCAVVWAACRLVTEGFRTGGLLPGEIRIAGWLALAVMAAALAGWSLRDHRQEKNTRYVIACVIVFLGSATAVVLIQNNLILERNAPAGLVIRVLCAALAMKAVLCMGRISRKQGNAE